MKGIILSLYDYSGAWSKPYQDAGYHVIQIDKQLCGQDVRILKFKDIPKNITGLLAAPPCTHLSKAGCQYWKEKGEAALIDGLSTIDCIYRIVHITNPKWWVYENPVGRLVHYVGLPRYTFQPWWFAGYADNPKGEAYSKKTLLWGNFNKNLVKNPIPRQKTFAETSARSMNARSKTPQGFARAFFAANP